jgi:hypothetical protein
LLFVSSYSPQTPRVLEIFDERVHPLSREPVPRDYDVHHPEHRDVYRFVKILFSAAQVNNTPIAVMICDDNDIIYS